MVTDSRSLKWAYKPYVEERNDALTDRSTFDASGSHGSLEDLEVGTEGGGRLNPESYMRETSPSDPNSDPSGRIDQRKQRGFD